MTQNNIVLRSTIFACVAILPIFSGQAFSQSVDVVKPQFSAEGASLNARPRDLVVTPAGQTVFLGTSYESFMHPLINELKTIRNSDNYRYQEILKGMAKTIAFKGLNVDPSIFSDGVPEFSFFDDLEVGSEDFFRKYYERIEERGADGVTMDGIVQIGDAYRENAVVTYQNSLRQFMPTIDKRLISLEEKQNQVRSILGRFLVIKPSILVADDRIFLSARVVNDVGFSVKGVTFSVSRFDDFGQDLDEYLVDVDFDRSINPSELIRLDQMEIFAPELKRGFVGGETPVILTAVKLIDSEGWEVTGNELDDAAVRLEDVRQDLNRFEWDLGMLLDEALDRKFSD